MELNRQIFLIIWFKSRLESIEIISFLEISYFLKLLRHANFVPAL